MKPQTRIKLFNEEYYGGGWASHTDKGVDPDVAWTQRPDVDRDYVTTGRLPDYQANYGQSDYIWYKYDRKRVNAEGEVEGGVVQVQVTAAPEDGRALASALGLRRVAVKLEAGATSRIKRFLVDGLNEATARQRLAG